LKPAEKWQVQRFVSWFYKPLLQPTYYGNYHQESFLPVKRTFAFPLRPLAELPFYKLFSIKN